MNPGNTPRLGDATEEVSALVEVLRETEQRIEDLTEGEVDSVTDRDGRTFLLRRAQAYVEIGERRRNQAVIAQSEAGLHRAQLMAKLAHVITGPDGSFKEWSETLPQLIGVDPARMPRTARAWLDMLHADDRGLLRYKAIKAGITKLQMGLEYRLRKGDGKWIYVQQCTEPLEDEGDVSVGTRWFHTLQDITAERKTKESLRWSESLKGAILESSLDCLITVDHEGSIVEFNHAAEATFGLARAQVLGKTMVDLIVPPRLREAHRSGFAHYLATGQGPILGKRLELDAIRADGTEFPIELAITALGATSTPMFTASIRDITARRQADQKIKHLNRVYAVLSGINSLIVREGDRKELFRGATRIAVDEGGFRMAWVGVVDKEAGLVKPIAAAGDVRDFFEIAPLATVETKPGGHGLAGRAIRDKRPVISNDVHRDPQRLMKRELVDRGINSVAIIPLIVGDEAVGVLALYAAEVGVFDQDEMQLLLELAGNIAFALEHIGEAEKLQRMTRVNAILSVINGAIVRIRNRQELFEEACRIAVETGGLSFAWLCVVDEAEKRLRPVASAGFDGGFLEKVRNQLSLRDDAPDGYGMAVRSVREGRALVANDVETDAAIKYKQAHADRGTKSVAILPLAIAGQVVGALALHAAEVGFFDSDEMKLLNEVAGNIAFALEHIEKEEKVRRLTRVHAVLSGINALIVRVRDRDELFREACRIAVQSGQFRLALVAVADPHDQRVNAVAWAGDDRGFVELARPTVDAKGQGKPGLGAQAIEKNIPAICNDIEADRSVMRYAKEALEHGYRSAAAFPLVVAGAAIGALVLYAGEPGFFDDEEIRLLQELGGNIAFAVDHIGKQERLDYVAYHDVLTGLANRTLLLERVAQYMRSAISGGHKLALFLIDLERFRNINDSLGQPAGDALLKQVAEWLTFNVEDVNLLARVGADHFALVLPEVKQEGDVARFLEKMMESFLEHPFRLNDTVFRVAAKVGVALFPEDGVDAAALFRNAEAALKKAKTSGERYLFYTQKMNDRVAGELSLENQLRQALDREEFVLHYQPKVSLASGKLTGAEALIRWNDPRTGLVPPGRFIPILEETGLILEVGRWALHKAIEDYLRWRAAGLAAVRIAVNVSPLQLCHRGFVAEIGSAIGIDSHAAAGLELEITEGMIMADVQQTIATLHAIRALGVTIAIDDFGTGFSSLSYLAKLPVDTLKIDRSFVIDMTVAPEGLALVSTIISLAHSLRLNVVAEGVETDEESRLLRLLKCDEMQGFLFSKPVPREVFEARFLVPLAAQAASHEVQEYE